MVDVDFAVSTNTDVGVASNTGKGSLNLDWRGLSTLMFWTIIILPMLALY